VYRLPETPCPACFVLGPACSRCLLLLVRRCGTGEAAAVWRLGRGSGPRGIRCHRGGLRQECALADLVVVAIDRVAKLVGRTCLRQRLRRVAVAVGSQVVVHRRRRLLRVEVVEQRRRLLLRGEEVVVPAERRLDKEGCLRRHPVEVVACDDRRVVVQRHRSLLPVVESRRG